MVPAEIIQKKRDGGELSAQEIAEFVAAYATERLPDYQMSALAMAICLRGMNRAEIVALTRAMLASGRTLSWHDRRPKVDKHSTGGLGDKVSLILAPLLACCDLIVPMISGRGLGITGGTLDKLEAIPGFDTQLPLDAFQRQAETLGCAMSGATADLAPADRKLYALRDVTGTVESIPLITASILSKKLAESLDALVLDVKWGSGAFMATLEQATSLAQTLVDVASSFDVKTTALVTDMNQPLGRAVGNAIEVQESVEVLRGAGPTDVRCLTCQLGAELLLLSGQAIDHASAVTRLEQLLDQGMAYERFERLVAAQGGRLPAVPLAPEQVVVAGRAGFVHRIDGRAIGTMIIRLGGGRTRMTDPIDPSVGLEILVRVGQEVEAGQPLARVFANQRDVHPITSWLQSAVAIEFARPVDIPPLIARHVTTHGVVSWPDSTRSSS